MNRFNELQEICLWWAKGCLKKQQPFATRSWLDSSTICLSGRLSMPVCTSILWTRTEERAFKSVVFWSIAHTNSHKTDQSPNGLDHLRKSWLSLLANYLESAHQRGAHIEKGKSHSFGKVDSKTANNLERIRPVKDDGKEEDKK